MPDELLDYVDENDRILGQVWRSEIDSKRLIGRVAIVLVFNSQGQLLICKNTDTKSSGSRWNFSSGGHIASGETPEITAIREAKEEIGIDLNPQDLEKITVLARTDQPDRPRRITHIFKTIHNGPFTLDQQEYASCRFATPQEIDELITNDPASFTHIFTKFWKTYRK